MNQKKWGETNKGMNPIELSLYSLGGFLKGTDGVNPGFEDISFVLNFDSDSPKEKIAELVELIESRCLVSDS